MNIIINVRIEIFYQYHRESLIISNKSGSICRHPLVLKGLKIVVTIFLYVGRDLIEITSLCHGR